MYILLTVNEYFRNNALKFHFSFTSEAAQPLSCQPKAEFRGKQTEMQYLKDTGITITKLYVFEPINCLNDLFQINGVIIKCMTNISNKYIGMEIKTMKRKTFALIIGIIYWNSKNDSHNMKIHLHKIYITKFTGKIRSTNFLIAITRTSCSVRKIK